MADQRLDIAFDDPALCLPETGRIAALNAGAETDYSRFVRDRFHPVTGFRPDYDRLSAAGNDVGDRPEGPYVLVLVHVSRNKAETLGLIAQAFRHAEPGAMIVVDGAKTDGIETALKHCRALFVPDGLISKAHGKTFWIRRPDILPAVLAEWEAELVPSENVDGYQTAPGMFSADHIDPASALLALHLDDRLAGQVADFGAGWGFLSSFVLFARGGVTGIDLYEANKAALDAARLNVTDPRASFHWADVLTTAIETRYDAVICNPPFHQGRAAEPSLGQAFISRAADILKPQGRLWLVANRQLPYEAHLTSLFAEVRVLDESRHYKAILASRPKSAKARARPSKPVRRA